MLARVLRDDGKGSRTIVVVFDTGDDVMAGLEAVAVDHRLDAAEFTAIGALARATLGFFDLTASDYLKVPVDEQVEVVSLIGNIARLDDGSPKVHAHVVLGTGDARGGHLLDGEVRPTLEVVIEESPGHLRRRHDPATGLPLIDLEQTAE